MPRGTTRAEVEFPLVDSVDFSHNAGGDEWANTFELD